MTFGLASSSIWSCIAPYFSVHSFIQLNMAYPAVSIQGLVEASVRTGSGSSGFMVYHCTASRSPSLQQGLEQHLKITLTSMAGEAETRMFTIPDTREVYIALDSAGSKLVVVDSGVVSISLRPHAAHIVPWFEAQRTESNDSDNDVFAPPVRRHLAPSASKPQNSTSSSSSSDDDDDEPAERCFYFPSKPISKKPRRYSLDIAKNSSALSTASMPTPSIQLRMAVSEPDVFEEEILDSPDISQAPSDGDLVSFV